MFPHILDQFCCWVCLSPWQAGLVKYKYSQLWALLQCKALGLGYFIILGYEVRDL